MIKMALKGSSGESLGAYETASEWRKMRKEKTSVSKIIANECLVRSKRE